MPPTYNGKIVTAVEARAFAEKTHITSIILPETIKEIRESAFAGNYNALMRLENIIFNGQNLKSIGNYAFQYCQKLNNINLPTSVENIGNGAFNNCVSLTSFQLPQKLTNLGFYVFSNCARLAEITTGINQNFSSVDGILYNFDKTELIKYPSGKQDSSFDLPQTIRKIHSESFYAVKNLTNLNLNEGLQEIGTRAFYDCPLQNIIIPSSMIVFNPAVFRNTTIKSIALSSSTEIIEDNFNGLYSLENIIVDSSNTMFATIDGVLYSKDKKTVIRFPINKKGKYSLPQGVKQIGDKAFYECVIGEVELNPGLENIGEKAFEYCKELLSITFPESLLQIGDDAFKNASNLSAVFVLSTNNYPNVGLYSFAGVGSNFAVYAPDEIVDEIIADTQWSNLDIVSNTMVNEDFHLILLDGYYKLIKVLNTGREITVPASIGGIEIRIIGKNAFASRVTKINLPSTITRIESYAFESNLDSNLTTIIIEEGSNLEQIGINAFYNCRMLTSLVLGSETPPYVVAESTILELSKHIKLYVPNIIAYQASELYNQLPLYNRNIIKDNFAIEEIDEGIKIIAYLGAETEIVFPTTMNTKSVVALGEYIINPTIQRVTIQDTITELANNTFSSEIYDSEIYTAIMALEYLFIDTNNLQSIGEKVFNGLSISEITLPKNLVTISSLAFTNCNELKRIIVNSENTNFKSIDGVLFNDDETRLIKYPMGSTRMEYSLPQTVRTVGKYAFAEVANLIIINLNDSLVAVESFAFQNCSNLLDIELPNGLLRVESFAFKGCYRINKLYLPASVEEFDATVILDCNALATINTSALSEKYVSIDGVLFDATKETLLSYPVGKKGAYTIPTSVKKLAPYAFYATTITSITIPDKIVEVGEFAFSNSQLVSITFGNGANLLPSGVLKNCEKLESLILPNTLEEIGDSFAEGCTKLRNFEFPSSLKSIGERAFATCNLLTSVVLPEGLHCIGYQAFNDCKNLTNISLPLLLNETFEILKGATALISIKMGVKNTINSLFGNQEGILPNTLKNITIQEGVSTLPEEFFNNHTEIQTVILPSTLIEIKKNAFKGCLSLISVEIKGVSMLERIEDRAFWNCKELIMLKINKANPPIVGIDVFIGDYDGSQKMLENLRIYVPSNYISNYESAWDVGIYAIS